MINTDLMGQRALCNAVQIYGFVLYSVAEEIHKTQYHLVDINSVKM